MSELARSLGDPRSSFDFSRLIFIAGFARGGTTWLRRALNQHPQISEIPVEINFHRERPLTRVKVAELLLDALPPDMSAGGHMVIKGPVNSLVFGEMAQLLPEARMVYIVRDPRDVLNSHRRGHQHWMKGRNETVEGCMAKTQRYFEGFLTAEGRQNVHLLQYERLHQRFPEVYAKLCRFAGIGDDPATIEACMHRSSFRALTGRDHAEESPESGARKGLVGDWVNYLTQADEDWLRTRPFWRNFFDRFGYRWEKPSVAGLTEACRRGGMPLASLAGGKGLTTVLVLESSRAEARRHLETARMRLEALGAVPLVALDERLASDGGAADLAAPLVRLVLRGEDGRPRFCAAGSLSAEERADPIAGLGALEDDGGVLRSFDLPCAVDTLEPFAGLGGRPLALISTPEHHPVDAPLTLAFRTAFAA